MPKNFYIGDLHIGHEKILWLDNRPFKDPAEMLARLERNWQSRVAPEDTVYVLGDMFWKTTDPAFQEGVLARLPGHKVLIKGNHDADLADGWDAAHDALQILDQNEKIWLCHYPNVAFPDFYKGAVHLYAHVHNSFENGVAEHVKSTLEALYERPCRMYNVGCMMPWMDYAPRTLQEIESNYRKCVLNRAYGAGAFRPETQKMLTLSTAHVSGSTAEKLAREPELNAMGIAVYPKQGDVDGEGFGWFVYLPENCDCPAIPDDLRRAIERARALECKILCLDCDGPEDPSLQSFDW